MTEDDSYCRKLIARFDRDRFLCTQFAPAERRAGLFALYAFNLEIAGVRESVSEPLVGQLRLKWWYDALDAIVAGTPPKHPVAEPLAEAVRRHDLPRTELDVLIEARSDDLEGTQPQSLAELERYCERSAAPLVRLALSVLGGGRQGADAVCRSAGIAWALTGHLRALPHHAAQGRLYLPVDFCREAGLAVEKPFARQAEGAEHERLKAVVRTVAAAAERHIEAARAGQQAIPKPARSVLLTCTLAEHYLTQLAESGFDPYGLRSQRPGPTGLIKVSWAGWRRRI